MFSFIDCSFGRLPQPLSLHPGAPRFALRSGLFPLDCVVTPTPRSSPEIPKIGISGGSVPDFPKSRKFAENSRKFEKNREIWGVGFWGPGGAGPPLPPKNPPQILGGFSEKPQKKGVLRNPKIDFFAKITHFLAFHLRE